MRIYDFDEKFFEYCRTWMALHPGLNEKQVEEHYNEIMLSWLNAPAKWLDGVRPGEYFNRYTEPRDLIKLLEEYAKRDIGLPEPLYSRIVALGEGCAAPLMRIVSDPDRPEELRATAIALLRDIGTDAPTELFIEMVATADQANELSEMASEVLVSAGGDVASQLLARYEDAPEYAQLLILDICCNYPSLPGVREKVEARLRASDGQRAYYASLLNKLGDPEALPLLMQLIQLSDLSYLDYIEIRNAVEALGGDPGEERTFYGDPDYEAMRNM